MSVSMSVSMYVYVCLCMSRYVYVCMHVCMYACLHVCMFACLHVCMHACTHAWMDGWVDGCMDASMGQYGQVTQVLSMAHRFVCSLIINLENCCLVPSKLLNKKKHPVHIPSKLNRMQISSGSSKLGAEPSQNYCVEFTFRNLHCRDGLCIFMPTISL